MKIIKFIYYTQVYSSIYLYRYIFKIVHIYRVTYHNNLTRYCEFIIEITEKNFNTKLLAFL